MKHGKKYQDSVKAFDLAKQYEAGEASPLCLKPQKQNLTKRSNCTFVWV